MSPSMSAWLKKSTVSLVVADGLFRLGLPMRGLAATGSFNCGGSVLVKPSLTKMIDFRPSRNPPSLTAAPFSAPIVTSFRIFSTVAAG